MKFLLEFATYKKRPDFELVSYEDNFDDPNAVAFELFISDGTVTRTLDIEYDAYLEFVEKIDPNLKSYIESAKLDDFESIFGDLQELGFDLKDSLQKYVNSVMSEERFAQLEYDEDQVSDSEMRNIFGIDDEPDDE